MGATIRSIHDIANNVAGAKDRNLNTMLSRLNWSTTEKDATQACLFNSI